MTARIVASAILGLLAATSANAEGGFGDGGNTGGGDSWLRSELHNPAFIQPYGYASPNRTEYRPFYGYGYPYTPYASPRAVIRVKRHGY